jgi:DNA-binding protein YbaB
MRNFQKLVAVLALSGLCFAVPSPSGSDAPKKSTKHAAKVVKKDPTAEQLKELKQAVDQQQAATQQLQEQLKQTQQQLQQTQQQLSQAQATANAANAKVATVETNTNMQVQKVESDLTDVKTALNTTEATVAKDEKKVDYLEHPASIAYKGIRITPGGFLEMTSYWRSHATVSDQATPFQAIPLEQQVNGAYNSNLTEFGMTARDSRIALRADADAGTTKLAGYFEMDFFGAAPTANPNQTTSYNPRMRQGWGRAKFANGWTITGGQMWNLITLNRKGTDADNSNLWIPNIIEAQYSVGYDWGRFAEVRVSKQITPSVNFAIGIANPSYDLAYGNEGVTGLAVAGNGLLATTVANISTNLAPDTIVKLAFDSPKLGHFEVKGIERFFRDRVPSTTTVPGWNNTAIGGGVGAGAIIPVVSKKVDFIAQGLWGKGISRYQDAGQYDFVVRSSGTTADHNLQPVKAFSVLAGFETHPNKKTELDLIYGQEYYYRDTYATTTATGTSIAGYGAPTTLAYGCYAEASAAANCTVNNKTVWNVKLYGYYDLYKGPMGTLRYGAEVDYDERQTWAGTGTATTLTGFSAPKGNDKTGFVTMRYIFP